MTEPRSSYDVFMSEVRAHSDHVCALASAIRESRESFLADHPTCAAVVWLVRLVLGSAALWTILSVVLLGDDVGFLGLIMVVFGLRPLGLVLGEVFARRPG